MKATTVAKALLISIYCLKYFHQLSFLSIVVDSQVIATGGYSSCVVLSEGKVKCWGRNYEGQLGLGDQDQRGDSIESMGDNLPFVDLGTNVTATDVAVGSVHSCALTSTQDVKCWGTNGFGQIGSGATATIGDGPGEMGDALPIVDLNGKKVKQITAGTYFTCLCFTDGSVACFGYNANGQLGLGDTTDRGRSPSNMGSGLAFVSLGTGITATMVKSGSAAGHACIITTAGKVKCWGNNFVGALGTGDAINYGSSSGTMGDDLPIVDLGTNYVALTVSPGGYQTCAILSTQQAKCWGYTSEGSQAIGTSGSEFGGTIGDDASDMGNNMVAMKLGTGVIPSKVVSGDQHACVLLTNNNLKCVGRGTWGQLGSGGTSNYGKTTQTVGDNLPVVSLGTSLPIQEISAGFTANCVYFITKQVKCFGQNSNGALGVGLLANAPSDNIGDGPGEMGTNLKFVHLFTSATPTRSPTKAPTTKTPSGSPTKKPSASPTKKPSLSPTKAPVTKSPTFTPTKNPTATPTKAPLTASPSNSPTKKPTLAPTLAPSDSPVTKSPTTSPTLNPTATPTRKPSNNPIKVPTTKPSKNPTKKPTKSPTGLCSYPKKKKCKADSRCKWSGGLCSPSF